MLKGLCDERIHFLFERQIDPDADGPREFGPDGRSFVCRLHQTWAAPGDDVALHFGQCGSHSFRLVISESTGTSPGGSENGHPIALTPGWLQACQVVYDIPQF